MEVRALTLTQEQRALLWLSTGEIAADRVYRLCREYGSAHALWEAFDTPGGPKFQEKPRQVLQSLHSSQAMEELEEGLAQRHIRLLFRQDAAYPWLLGEIDDPPYLLYYAGDLQALRRPLVAVVGTRQPSGYGQDVARAIARGLAEAGVGVVSGMARGIDSCAHEGALQGRGVTIAVLGSGLNVPYPPENRNMLAAIATSGGLALSEFPPDAGPVPYHFPHRNRVISGLSHGLVFVEGRIKSGGMITVATALKQGREVFAVPGQVGASGAEGPHVIIREGARVVTCAQDILDDLSLGSLSSDVSKVAQSAALESGGSPLALQLEAALTREALPLEALCKATGHKQEEVLTQLTLMELGGQIRREPGNRFALAL